MSSGVLHTQDHKRYGTRAFLRLELTDDAVIVVVHELGPLHVRADSQESRDAWQTWQEQLEPPALTDDLGTTYAPSRERRAVGPGGSPSTGSDSDEGNCLLALSAAATPRGPPLDHRRAVDCGTLPRLKS